jgi:biotin carboxyl carrier protein
MKMENEMKSPFGGSVRRLMVKPGQNVEKGQVLFIVE